MRIIQSPAVISPTLVNAVKGLFTWTRSNIGFVCSLTRGKGCFIPAQKTGNANVPIIYHTFSQKTPLPRLRREIPKY